MQDNLPVQDDLQCVLLAKAGDMAAFEALITRYEGRIFSLGRRILGTQEDAEDVTQQTFLSVVEHLDGFRGDSSFLTWLMRIATHASLKILRKRKGLEFVSLDEATESPSDSDAIPHPEYIADWSESPSDLAQRNETQQFIDNALARLDEKHRLVFLLRDVEGWSIKETAETLGMSEANVKVRLLRARLQLREQLTRVFGDESKRVLPGHSHREAQETT